MAYPEAKKARALQLMTRSAQTTPSGRPAFSVISIDTGITSQTLRRWWKERLEANEEAKPEATNVEPIDRRQPPTPAGLDTVEVAVQSSAASGFYLHVMGKLAGDAENMSLSQVYTQLPRTRMYIVELYEKYRAALKEEGGGRKLSPDEVEQQIRAGVAGVSPRHAMVMLEELKRRGLA